MKKIFGILAGLALIGQIFAADKVAAESKSEATATLIPMVSGRITDKISGESLAGVEVQLMDTDHKTYTDFDGNFEFKNISPGAHAVKVGYISYQEVVKNVYAANNSKPVQIKLESVKK